MNSSTNKVQVIKLNTTSIPETPTAGALPSRKRLQQRRWNNNNYHNKIDDILKEFGNNQPQNISLITKRSPNRTGKSYRFTLDDISTVIPTSPETNPLISQKTTGAIKPIPFQPVSPKILNKYTSINSPPDKTPPKLITPPHIAQQQTASLTVQPSISPPPWAARKASSSSDINKLGGSKGKISNYIIIDNELRSKKNPSSSTTKLTSKSTKTTKVTKAKSKSLTKSKSPPTKSNSNTKPNKLTPTNNLISYRTISLKYLGAYLNPIRKQIPSDAKFLLVQQGYLKDGTNPPQLFIERFYQLISDNTIHITKYKYLETE